MNSQLHSGRPQWTSAAGYFLVTIGAIVGIGNILIFPFLTLKYGGLFVLFYFLCEIALAVPLLYTELMVGRCAKQNPVGAIGLLAYEGRAGSYWQKLGWLYFIVAFLTFSYYIIYMAFPIGFASNGIRSLYAYEEANQGVMNINMLTNFFVLEAWILVLLVSVMVVVARGINRGLEKISCISVPLYSAILIGLAIYAIASNNFGDMLKNLFSMPLDTSIITVFFAALTFAFLKLSVGIGSMIIYGSHLPYAVSLKRSTVWIILFDMGICLLCYFIVYPLAKPLGTDLFIGELNSYNVASVFAKIYYGTTVPPLFFLAAVIASWTVLIAMLETMVATVSEQFNMLRSRAVLLVGVGLFLTASFFLICQITEIDEDFFGYVISPYFLREIALEKLTPITAFFMAIFAGWVIDKKISMAELKFNPWIYHIWRFLIRYLVPALIMIIFIYDIYHSNSSGI